MTSAPFVDATEYYESRQLEVPSGEVRPASQQALCEAIDDLENRGQPWQMVGDAQHIRRTADKSRGQWTAVRTDRLDQIMTLDHKSGLVRVEAGMRWRALRQALNEHDLSLQRYGLHPATATVGGMLARQRPGPPILRGGSIVDGCVSISAHSPADGNYRYLVAPRKASGPDLRHKFMGAGSRRAAILDATLVVWKPVTQSLFHYQDQSLTDAAAMMKNLFEADIKPACVHYSHRRQSLQFIVTAPGQLLRRRAQWIAAHLGAPDDRGDTDEAATRRDWLEARHPDRRSHPDAAQTRVFWLAPAALDANPQALFGPGFEDIEIARWNANHIEAFVRFDSPQTANQIMEMPARSCWAHWPLIAN